MKIDRKLSKNEMKKSSNKIAKRRKHKKFDKTKTNKLNRQNILYDDCRNAINDTK